ncbi:MULTISPECIES: PH domain-containing protein [unclassified Streptomyces]|uniref:PH domain-containing protein n=1 Tax=unclassified Streptomyces TaxID=2593676 RepID=UPI001BE7672D|nr:MULTISPECIES: PH domain-containing protein [unclassified Streptomyces]MBT2408413.1 PH domain-containing protein [Streptomyces sp. ISL-21]MBT2457139.1 PH domain-containing protein [Streptomyces sp. ISL-86]MBT2608156.1 PH domain-containing protein [Streptomyces sp. ISL-87]
MSADRLPRDYRIRPARVTGNYTAMGLGAASSLLSLSMEDFPGRLKLLFGALMLALFGWLAYASKRCATSADLKGIRVRRLRGSRRLAWEDIQGIRAVPNPVAAKAAHQPNVISYAYDRAGRRVQLMYVDDNHVDVGHEIGLMRAAWEELRGEGWEPDPEVLRRIERRHGREGRMLARVLWGLGAVVAIFVVVMIRAAVD